MQDKSGIHRLKSRSAILALTHRCQMTILAKLVVTDAGADVDSAPRAMQSITSHVGEWETPNVREQVYSGAQAWDAECRFCFRPKVKHEHRWGVGECKGGFPSLPSRPFAM